MSSHTPTPWEVSKVGFRTNEGQVPILGRDGDVGMKRERDANAEFIVRAVNAHDSLVAALEECVSVLTDPVVGTIDHDEPRWYRSLGAAVDKARAALSLARPTQEKSNG